jgi:hypothetical protein
MSVPKTKAGYAMIYVQGWKRAIERGELELTYPAGSASRATRDRQMFNGLREAMRKEAHAATLPVEELALLTEMEDFSISMSQGEGGERKLIFRKQTLPKELAAINEEYMREEQARLLRVLNGPAPAPKGEISEEAAKSKLLRSLGMV